MGAFGESIVRYFVQKAVAQFIRTLLLGLFCALIFYFHPKNNTLWILHAFLEFILFWSLFSGIAYSSLLIRYLYRWGKYLLFKLFAPNSYYTITLEEIDQMTGEEFEKYILYLLKRLGYRGVKKTKQQADQGIDLLANKGEVRYGVQCKRWQSNIGNSAIQETYSGIGFYRLDEGIVVTNQYFTPSAKALAHNLKITLWDRDELHALIEKSR